MSIEIAIFISSSGKKPFVTWENDLSREVRAIVTTRLSRLRLGNFGDCKAMQNAQGIYELRIHFGPGYRVYFGKEKNTLILLLCGGDKSSQNKDIKKAKQYWEEYLQDKKGNKK